ncbi:hypothetical protein GCM10023217_27020 [Gordonia alkaliphila]|uniref:Uncharacterized protein n=1 Tax=Gordonia alkaliphila TaxID=1053547 RepID=A0ABP8ZEE8_9ACTN
MDGTKHAMATLRNRLGVDPSLVMPCEALPQMMDGSLFIAEMNPDGHPYLPGIEYTNISGSSLRGMAGAPEFITPFANTPRRPRSG